MFLFTPNIVHSTHYHHILQSYVDSFSGHFIETIHCVSKVYAMHVTSCASIYGDDFIYILVYNSPNMCAMFHYIFIKL